MKLKRVEIQGFKSFVDRTRLDFHSGITAIVGPNGCGKSNLVDAIRWVLGENNARTLRGALMEDIVFSGTELRPPLSLAEVSLTLSNEDGSAPAQYHSVPEISVTRRVFRDGESEYEINKTPCRLKDITDLFMGTGANFYSVIEQGKISSIVSAKPEELRTFIEEAAGITFYKSRKRAALRRIDATQKNLVRVSDILSEISRQIRYLERQARKAERFREHQGRLRLLELNQVFFELGEIDSQLANLATEKETLDATLTGAESRSETFAADIESFKLELHESELALQQAQKSFFEAGKSLAEKENQYEYLRKEITELGERRVNLSKDIERNHLKAELTQDELASGKVELKKLSEQNSGHHKRLQELEEKRASLEAQLKEGQQESERLKQNLMQQLTEVTSLKHQLESMHVEDDRKQAEATRWLEEKAGLTKELDQHNNEKVGVKTNEEELEMRWQEAEATEERLAAELSEFAETIDRLNQEREQLSLELAQTNSKIESLKAFEKESGVESFLHRLKETNSGKVANRLADCIQVPRDYEKAVESLLSHELNWIVIDDEQNPATMMLEITKDETIPRGTVISTQTRGTNRAPESAATLKAAAGVRGRMAELIEATAERRAILEYLCGEAWVVENLNTASKLADSVDVGVKLITLAGEVVVVGGEVTAGKQQSGNQGILQRQRQLTELQDASVTLEERRRKVEADLQVAQSEHEQCESELNETTETRHNLRLQRVEVEKDLARIDSDIERVTKKLEQLKSEHSSVLTSQEALKESQLGQRRELVAAEEAHAKLNQQETALNELTQETTNQLESTKELLTQIRVENASSLEREEHLTQEQLRLQNELDSLNATNVRQKEELQQLWQREQNGRESIEGLESTVSEARDSVASLESTFQECQRSYQEKQSKLQQMDMSRRESENNVNQLTRELSKLEISINEFSTKKQHLRDLMIEKWQVDLTAVAPEPTIEITDELKQEIDELRTTIAKMGEVNLGAVDEHAFLQERFEYLTAQSNDLEESLKRLQQTIRKIDATTKKLFFDAFDGINKELKQLFPKLFRGGKAELLLMGEEDQDPLERGMTIMARPPGKRLQHINLLSGGEKSLTAAALIFAIFRYKPTPFSILDEVDAALDDENTRRLNTIAQEIANDSQLVLITHNKTTMEIAQHLYGITMGEPGVTKIVSVRLDEAERVHAAEPAAEESSPADQSTVAVA